MTRLSQRSPDQLSEQERAILAEIMRSRGSLAGPFAAWLYSPDLADRAQRLGETVRYHTSLPPHLSELAILITARYHNCLLEWALHEPIARQAGLSPAIIAALEQDETPLFAGEEDSALYAYCWELHNTKFVSDGTYNRTVDALGLQAVVELTMLMGYYTLVAYTLNAFQIEE